jgi:hypothetical protein
MRLGMLFQFVQLFLQLEDRLFKVEQVLHRPTV